MKNNSKILVTGANGFIGAHIITQLINENYDVIGTVRTEQKKLKTFERYTELLGDKCKKHLQLEIADLGNQNDWEKIIQKCDVLMHVATPIYFKVPNQKEEQSILNQAVNGTENILELCAKYKLKKIVMTSSVAAISLDMNSDQEIFDKNDWTPSDIKVTYPLQKTLQEKKAWEIAQKHNLNLTTICPVTVLGKQLMKSRVSTTHMIKFLFRSPIYVDVNMAIVDVVDVAKTHVQCMKNCERTRNKRYIVSQGTYNSEDMVNILRQEFSQYGYWLSLYKFPKVILGFVGMFFKSVQKIYKTLNKRIIYDCVETSQDLNMQYISLRETLKNTVYDLVDQGVIENKIRY